MTRATFTVELDINKDKTFGAADADITDRVLAMSWNEGMDDSFDEVSSPAQLTIELDNSDGRFTAETLGANLITNGTFASWSGGLPVGWTVSSPSGSNEITEVGNGKLHGEGGTGTLNFYAPSSDMEIYQAILTVGQRYYCEFSITAISGTGGVVCRSGSDAVSPVYHKVGAKRFSFTATATNFYIRSSGTANVSIDDVVVKLGSLYHGVLSKRPLIRVRQTFNAVTYDRYIGRVIESKHTPGITSARTIQLICQDPMLLMLASEYSPPLQRDVTVDEVLDGIFDNAVVDYPYASSYWVLDAEGASELGATTTLWNHNATSFDSGATKLAFVGDNSDRGRGVNVQGFIRDLIASEAGGRFFYDVRNAQYVFHSRHRDILNLTSQASFDESQFEEAGTEYLHNKDLANIVSIKYQPRKTGTPGSVLYSHEHVPFLLQAGQTKVITGRFRDPDNPSALVGGVDVIAPLPTTDVLAVRDGVDRSNQLSISSKIDANSIEFTITNRHVARVAINRLQVRGTPLISYVKAMAQSIDADSIREYGQAEKASLNIPMIGDEELAQNYADFLVAKFKEPLSRFKTVCFNANRSDTLMTQALQRVLGDRITVSESWLGHSQDYIIVGARHAVIAGGDNTYLCTWVLKPTRTEIFWQLGSAGYGELDEASRLAF